ATDDPNHDDRAGLRGAGGVRTGVGEQHVRGGRRAPQRPRARLAGAAVPAAAVRLAGRAGLRRPARPAVLRPAALPLRPAAVPAGLRPGPGVRAGAGPPRPGGPPLQQRLERERDPRRVPAGPAAAHARRQAHQARRHHRRHGRRGDRRHHESRPHQGRRDRRRRRRHPRRGDRQQRRQEAGAVL
ncbi:MAG: hypothetical protein AVDCRST_MAG40-2659, partial [uncultured Gemmatimonadaceae bacterium]